MKIKVNQQQQHAISVGIQGPKGPSGPNILSTADDVDVSDLKDGSILVYSTAINKWEATTRLQKQELEGGQF